MAWMVFQGKSVSRQSTTLRRLDQDFLILQPLCRSLYAMLSLGISALHWQSFVSGAGSVLCASAVAPSLTHNAVAVAVSHILVGGLPARHRRDAVPLRFGAGDSAIVIAVVQLRRMSAAKRSAGLHDALPARPALPAGLPGAPAGLLALFAVAVKGFG